MAFLSGINWPENEKTGKRSSTDTGKAIWTAAIEGVDEKIAANIAKETSWRKKYDQHLANLAVSQFTSAESVLSVASNGLQALYDKFTLIESNGVDDIAHEVSLAEAEAEEPTFHLETVTVEGVGSSSSEEYLLNLVTRSDILQRVDEKAVEPDVLEAFDDLMKTAQEDPDLLNDLKENIAFVVLGATSELCPLKNLLLAGFTVVGVSRPKQSSQKDLIDFAQTSPGTLILPMIPDTECSGVDVMQNPLELSEWLINLLPEKRLIVGSYIYLDGAKNVQACLGMDFIVKQLMKARPDTGMALLATPAIAVPISPSAAAESENAYNNRSILDYPLSFVAGPFTKNRISKVAFHSGEEEKDVFILDNFANYQGPSYALAKTLQVWRCELAASSGNFVSYNVCPPCYTDSVVHVKSAAMVLRGMKAKFPPLTYFLPVPARDLMFLMLLSDLVDEKRKLAPNSDIISIISSKAVHGGSWTAPYAGTSIFKAAYLYGYFY